MALCIGIGVALQWAMQWQNAGAIGAIVGLIGAQLVPMTGTCGVKRPPLPGA